MALALFLALALLAAACGEDDDSNEEGGSDTTAAAGDDGGEGGDAADFSACQVTDTGGVDDRSFNQSSWAGMQAAKDDNPDIDISYAP
ncbi:MAG TPA: hypothetical protein VF640_06880, partial [Acidimicrobiales bacterium]